MERIHLNDVRKKMDECRYLKNSETFSIRYLKADMKRKTGGQWVFIERAQMCGLPYSVKDNDMIGLVNMDSGIKTAVHCQLIYELNGSRVYK